jgi:excisionase family DNA binding protein
MSTPNTHTILPNVAKIAKYCRVSPMVESQSEILTIDEVASYLKVAERTVYRLAAAKKIPAFKVGGAWRFSRAEIDQWIRKQSSAVPGSDGSSSAGTGRRA